MLQSQHNIFNRAWIVNRLSWLVLSFIAFTFSPVSAQETHIVDYRYLDEIPQVREKGTLITPESSKDFTVQGYVLLWVTLNEDGSVDHLEIMGSNHPYYAESAVNAVLKSKFSPPLHKGEAVGTQLPISVRFPPEEVVVEYKEPANYAVLSGEDFQQLTEPVYPSPGLIEYRVSPKYSEISWGLKKTYENLNKTAGSGTHDYFDFKSEVLEGPFPYDKAPRVIRFYFPYFPSEKVISGKGREKVTVSWIVDPNGFPIDPTAEPDADPDFARAAEACIRYWRFSPGELEGAPTAAGLAYPFTFDRFHVDRQLRNKAKQLYQGAIDFTAPSELDAPLKIRVKQAVLFPRRKDRAGGYADIKIHVDPDGQVFLPEIVETNNEDIAWSALTAVDQWRFDPPLRKGEPTFVVFKQRFEN